MPKCTVHKLPSIQPKCAWTCKILVLVIQITFLIIFLLRYILFFPEQKNNPGHLLKHFPMPTTNIIATLIYRSHVVLRCSDRTIWYIWPYCCRHRRSFIIQRANQSRLFWYFYQFVLLFYYFGKLFGSVRLFHLPNRKECPNVHPPIRPTGNKKKRFRNQWKLSGPPHPRKQNPEKLKQPFDSIPSFCYRRATDESANYTGSKRLCWLAMPGRMSFFSENKTTFMCSDGNLWSFAGTRPKNLTVHKVQEFMLSTRTPDYWFFVMFTNDTERTNTEGM
jgi:hypothetical protein